MQQAVQASKHLHIAKFQKRACVKALNNRQEPSDGEPFPDAKVWGGSRHDLEAQINRVDGNVSHLQDQISMVSSNVASIQGQMSQLTQAVAHITNLLGDSTIKRDAASTIVGRGGIPDGHMRADIELDLVVQGEVTGDHDKGALADANVEHAWLRGEDILILDGLRIEAEGGKQEMA